MPSMTIASVVPATRPQAPGFRDHLRQATGARHAQLDSSLGALRLDSRAGYRSFLQISAAALLPLEDALEAADVLRLFPDWPRRSRRVAILDDLAQLDGELRPMPFDRTLNVGGVLGVMYVLEGSRLGAKFLLRTVAKSSDPLVAGATAYLRHGEGEGLWPSCLAALEYHAARIGDDDTGDAVDAACRAFDMFAQAAERVQSPASELQPL